MAAKHSLSGVKKIEEGHWEGKCSCGDAWVGGSEQAIKDAHELHKEPS